MLNLGATAMERAKYMTVDGRNRVDRRVLCIGLDGASPKVVHQLVRLGLLPNLGRLLQEGVSGPLRSVHPPLSPPAWTSFATGVGPGKHGVFDFVVRDPSDGHFRVANRTSVRLPAVWDLLSQAGFRVGVMSVPMTYPPQPLNGFMVSGFDAPQKRRATTYPPELAEEIERRVGIFWVERRPYSLIPTRSSSFLRRYVRDVVEMTRQHGEVARWLLEREDPDVFFVVLIGTDRLQHVDGEGLARILAGGENPQDWLESPAVQAYMAADEVVGDLTRGLDDRWQVILLSDHGFEPYRWAVSLNAWLEERGYLRMRRSRGSYWSSALNALSPAALSLWRRICRQSSLSLFMEEVDWLHTVAYSIGAFGSIYINLEGREPSGTVKPGRDADALIARLTEELLSWVDPATGHRPVARVLSASEVLHGPMVPWGPDLLLETTPGYFMRSTLDTRGGPVIRPAGRYAGRHLPHTAMHHPDGILCISGVLASDGGAVRHGARIIDVAPTVLALMGLAPPPHMDGRVLTDWLVPEAIGDMAISWPEDGQWSSLGDDGDYTEEQHQTVLRHLRDLGYL